jgi:hypothetical protein
LIPLLGVIEPVTVRLSVRLAAIFLFLPLVFVACEGEVGPTGPAGPQGAEGAVGPAGPIGNANIISGSATYADADWSTTLVQFSYRSNPSVIQFGKQARWIDIAVPELTASVITDGAVFMWMRPISSVLVPLPYRFQPVSSVWIHNYTHEIREGELRLLYYLENQEDAADISLSPLTITQATREFRWMIIPPTVTTNLIGLPLELGPEAVAGELRRRGLELASRP